MECTFCLVIMVLAVLTTTIIMYHFISKRKKEVVVLNNNHSALIIPFSSHFFVLVKTIKYNEYRKNKENKNFLHERDNIITFNDFVNGVAINNIKHNV